MKRTLLHTSLLAILACYSVSMGASAMKAEGESSQFIRTVRVLPLLKNERVVDSLLNTATRRKILNTVEIHMGPGAANGLQEVLKDSTSIIKQGTTVDMDSVRLKIDLPDANSFTVTADGGEFKLEYPISTAPRVIELPSHAQGSSCTQRAGNGTLQASLELTFSFEDGNRMFQGFYINGKLFHPTKKAENTVDGIPFAYALTGDTLELELVKANKLFLAGRDPQAQTGAGFASYSAESSSVPTSQE